MADDSIALMGELQGLEPLFPDRASAEPLGRQLVRRLRTAIQNGHFKPASRLLPSRELAGRLGLSRNLVLAAIEQLIGEGYLESRAGSGTFVSSEITRAPRPSTGLHATPAVPERFRFAETTLDEYSKGFGPLRTGVPDLSNFPHATWARITRRKLGEPSTYSSLPEATGDVALREAIAQHVQQFRGVAAEAERVVVVEGAQAAIRLAADVLLTESDCVAIEDPCYPFAFAALEARGIRLLPVPVDDDGMDVALTPPARLALVSPSHQCPLGSKLSLERRHALLAWALEHDAYVIEDDYDSEYEFDGKPLPTLQSIDRHERVIYVGTFSKTLAPGLRLGYLIVPPHLVKLFSIGRFLSNLGGTRYVQATLAEFLSEGHFANHVRRMTRLYRTRRKALVQLLSQELSPARFHLGRISCGLTVAVIAPNDFDDIAVQRALLDDGVWVQALSTFCIARTDCRGFVLGFTAEPMADVMGAARRLVSAIRQEP